MVLYMIVQKGDTMRSLRHVLLGLIVMCGPASHASSITGTVKGPDSAAFQDAFVEAQNMKTRITFSVLSDTQGYYRIENLPAGQYRLLIRAVGYQTDPRMGISLAADQNASVDFALQKGVVRWNDISIYQATQLFPAGKGKDLLFQNCEI